MEALEFTPFSIEVGFRHIDCAHLYQNEEQVGQAIQSKIADGTVKREDIFCTSKVLCVLWVCAHVCKWLCPGGNYKTESFGEELLVSYVYWYITKVLEFAGGSVVKTWCFTAVSQDLILGWGSNIPQAHGMAKKNFLKYY